MKDMMYPVILRLSWKNAERETIMNTIKLHPVTDRMACVH